MSNGLLGMDVGAARLLADSLSTWSADTEEILCDLLTAQGLSDVHPGVLGAIDEIGADGSAMAVAIRRAADELSSFSIELASPLAVHAAVAAIYSFQGSDNDPELDRRVRRLQRLVDAATDSPEEAARMMSTLLAAGKTDDIAAVMGDIERLNLAEARGEIGSNEPVIDEAVSTLRAALGGYASSDEQLQVLVGAFLADNNHTAVPDLLASVLTGQKVPVVQAAHTNAWDYDVAVGVFMAQRVDRLSSAIRTAPFPEVAELERERAALFAELAGASDTATLDEFARTADQGVPALLAMDQVWRRQEAERAEQVEVVANEFGLDQASAAHKLDYMTRSVQTLTTSGWDRRDASFAVTEAAKHGLDIDAVERLATEKETSLTTAAHLMTQSNELEMSVDEVEAFTGFIEHFELFDTVLGGEADGLVSLADLRYMVNHSQVVGTQEDVARWQAAVRAAAAFLDQDGLRHRLDSAAQTGAVVSQNPFGRDRAADNKYSAADVALFIDKQKTNFALRGVVDEIDVARTAGTSGRIDHRLSEADFQVVRALHQEYRLTDAEIAAIDRVLELDWYHPTFMQDHSDAIILGAAVIAGVMASAATAGAAGGVAGVLISSAAGATAGAATGAGLTVASNAWSSDPLAEDLANNTALGLMGGVAGSGFYGFYSQSASSPLAIRVLSTVGVTADVAGLAAAGAVDPLLTPFVDEIELNQMHDDFQNVNYLLGTGSVAINGLTKGAADALEETAVRTAGAGLDQVIADLNDVDQVDGAIEQGVLHAHD